MNRGLNRKGRVKSPRHHTKRRRVEFISVAVDLGREEAPPTREDPRVRTFIYHYKHQIEEALTKGGHAGVMKVVVGDYHWLHEVLPRYEAVAFDLQNLQAIRWSGTWGGDKVEDGILVRPSLTSLWVLVKPY